MPNRTRKQKRVQSAEPQPRTSVQLVAAAIRGAVSGTFRSGTDWVVRMFTTH
jgi:hypothetical protein